MTVEVKNYKRKPTVVQAIQFTGNNFDDFEEFGGISIDRDSVTNIIDIDNGNRLSFSYDTNEGKVRVETGDYLVKGIDGLVYPCNRKMFSLIYEETELPFKLAEGFEEKGEKS